MGMCWGFAVFILGCEIRKCRKSEFNLVGGHIKFLSIEYIVK